MAREVLVAAMQQIIDSIVALAETHAEQPMLSYPMVKLQARPLWVKKLAKCGLPFGTSNQAIQTS